MLSVVVVFLANEIAIVFADALSHGSQRRLDLVYRPLTTVLLLLGFSALLRIFDEVPGNPLPAMGLSRERWLRDSLWGLLLGLLLVTLAVVPAILTLGGTLDFHLTGKSLRPAVIELVILAFGAMSEELMFRGYPFQRLVESTGAISAIAIFSALFGAVHLMNPGASAIGFGNTILIGIVLALLYLRTRALWYPFGLHFGWNFALGWLYGLPVSGLRDFSIIMHGRLKGPVWVTGGVYGIEGGLLGTGAVLTGLIWVWFFVPQRPVTVDGSSPAGIQTNQAEGPHGTDV